MEEMKYVFISHKNVEPDVGITARLYHFLSANNLMAWYDRDLRSGDWPRQLSEKIHDASIYVLIASKDSLVADEVLDEVGIMRGERNKRGKKIIPFIIDDYFFNMPAGSADYFLGSNRNQAVVLSKFASEEEAFERLKFYLLDELEEYRNNPDDFEFEGHVLKRYKGSDPIVFVPKFVEEIGENAFAGNRTLEKVVIPASVHCIGYKAFFGCGNLTAVDGMEGVTCCEQSAFERAPVFPERGPRLLNGVLFGGIEHGDVFEIPAGTRTIAACAFVCDCAKEVIFPEGLMSIGAYAFRDSCDLMRVCFPHTLREVGRGAFCGCFSLKKAVFPGEMPPKVSEAFENTILEEAK